MAGTGESCSLCESLRDPESAAGHEATLAQLEATAPICPLCAILLEVVRHYEPDEAARKLGVLKWREVPLSAMDRLWETNIPLLGWVQDPRGTRITRSIYAFRVRGMSLFFSLSLSLCLSFSLIYIYTPGMHTVSNHLILILWRVFLTQNGQVILTMKVGSARLYHFYQVESSCLTIRRPTRASRGSKPRSVHVTETTIASTKTSPGFSRLGC
jgi:hypothetical protein